jgi:hypothetical protein
MGLQQIELRVQASYVVPIDVRAHLLVYFFD